MIRNFSDLETEKVFLRERSRVFSPQVQRLAQRRLAILHAAASLEDLRSPPGNRLETLSGVRQGQSCIRINDQSRILFQWGQGNAYDVGIALEGN
ncbi:MAG: proteic killer suppression protein [Chloroflexi bacterium]|jgi:proteic killer suppression protein|nr:MAG: proteic killer suppression protein [Chloroflexota bacterium]